jgi:hypothetical protein
MEDFLLSTKKGRLGQRNLCSVEERFLDLNAPRCQRWPVENGLWRENRRLLLPVDNRARQARRPRGREERGSFPGRNRHFGPVLHLVQVP